MGQAQRSRSRRTRRWPPAAVALIALVAAPYGTAFAHDQGVLKLVSKRFRAGDSLAVTGAKFTPKDEVTLVLIGVTGRVALGDIPTDTSGAFRRVVLVPASIAAGQYRLVAEAIDGDQVASLEVMVEPASATASGPAPMAAMPGMEGMPGHDGMTKDPTGEPLELTRSRSTAVTGTAIVLIIACVAGGALLLRGPRANPTEEHA